MREIKLVPIVLIFISCFTSCICEKEKSYHFDETGISEEVFGNYLDRSVTMAFFLVPNKPEGMRKYPFHEDDIRLIKNMEAKFLKTAPKDSII